MRHLRLSSPCACLWHLGNVSPGVPPPSFASVDHKMDPIVKAPVRKQGIVEKLGGQQGGHRTWKARYFVLTDQLAYYNKQADYASGASPNLIRLSAYFVSATETFRKKGEAKPKGGFFEFQIHAYPKSMTCRTKEESVMHEWIRAIMEPIEQMRRPIRDIRLERKAKELAMEEAVKSGKPVDPAAIAAGGVAAEEPAAGAAAAASAGAASS